MRFGTAAVRAPGHVGWSIALLFALNGIPAEVDCAEADAETTGRQALAAWRDRAIARGTLSRAQADQVRARIGWRPLSPAGAPDLVVVELRHREQIDEIVALERTLPPATVVGVASLLLPLGPMTARFAHPERAIGMHFMHPAHARKAIEIIPTGLNDDRVRERVLAFCRDRLSLCTVVCRDQPGFVVNRVHLAYLAAAVRVWADYPDQAAELDELLRTALGLPMGPYRLMDELGLPNVRASLETMAAESGTAYEVSDELTRLTGAGRLGRASGAGFLDY